MNDMTFAQRMAAGKAKKAADKSKLTAGEALTRDLNALDAKALTDIDHVAPGKVSTKVRKAKMIVPIVRRGGEGFKKAKLDVPARGEAKNKKAKPDLGVNNVGVKITPELRKLAQHNALNRDPPRAKAKGKKALPPKPIFAAKTASAKHIKGVDDLSKPHAKLGPAPKVVKRVVVVKAKAKPAPVPEVQDAAALPGGPLLMERSYKRAFVGMGATMRGKVLQITVTFKPEQFDVLKERADLYQCSLAEAVRKCVMSGPLP